MTLSANLKTPRAIVLTMHNCGFTFGTLGVGPGIVSVTYLAVSEEDEPTPHTGWAANGPAPIPGPTPDPNP